MIMVFKELFFENIFKYEDLEDWMLWMFRGTFEIAKMVAIIGKFEKIATRWHCLIEIVLRNRKHDLEALFDLFWPRYDLKLSQFLVSFSLSFAAIYYPVQ